MDKLSFFTPVDYGPKASASERTLQTIDNYFNFFGKKAVVIKGPLQEGKEQVYLDNVGVTALTYLKITGVMLSLFTIVIPVVLLISKALLRSAHSYRIIDPKRPQEDHEKIAKAAH